MDAVTYELDQDESSIVAAVRDWVTREAAGSARARARERLSGEAHRADEADGRLRPGDPRAVRRRAGLDALLRAGDRGACPRLDEPGRGDGRPHRRREAAARRSAPRSRRRATCRGWRPARSGRRWRSPSRAAAPTCRRCARRARRDGDGYVVNGSKTWITNARRRGLIALLCKTDPDASPAHRGHQHPARRARARASRCRGPAQARLQGRRELRAGLRRLPRAGRRAARRRRGAGFAQMMSGLEIGRIQVAARALGVGARRARRRAGVRPGAREFGKPIWQHQSIGNYLADMATKLTAARQLVCYAAEPLRARRARRHGGRAWPSCSPPRPRMEIALNAVRDPRRLRLLDRVRRRAVLPRRAADDRRRGHQRDPAQRHRQAARSNATRSSRERRTVRSNPHLNRRVDLRGTASSQ